MQAEQLPMVPEEHTAQSVGHAEHYDALESK